MTGQTPRPDAPDAAPEPRRLRQLRHLVTALTLTMIVGLITVTGLLVIRLTAVPAPIALPDPLRLPAGERAEAVTLGGTWIAVVTRDAAGVERIRVLDRATGADRGSARVAPGP